MSEQTASRTLLKSPPELWAECSDAQSLARHLDTFFGDVRITRLEPESTVAWEGERGSGTVRLEPAGWGTRVTLTASVAADERPNGVDRAGAAPPPATAEPPAEAELFAPATIEERRGAPMPGRSGPRPATFLARVLRRFGTEHESPAPHAAASEPPARVVADPIPPAPIAEPPTAAPTPPPPESPAGEPPGEAAAVLAAALDSLGKAHHRPFSRS